RGSFHARRAAPRRIAAVLMSPRFADNKRLQSAAENNPALKAFEPDKDAVRLLQQALRDLRDPLIGALPISFRQGAPDGGYGEEPAGAAGKPQRGKSLPAAGAGGHDTLHALDALSPARGPAPPEPKPPAPTEEEVTAFLSNHHRRDVVSVLIEQRANM